MIFDSNFVRFKDNTTGDVLLHASSVDNVYPVCLPAKSTLVPANLAFSSSVEHWHRHLGHCGAHTLAILKKKTMFRMFLLRLMTIV